MKTDVMLIGAGPIGIEMASVLKRSGVSYIQVETGQIGATIARWPRSTRFFSSAEWIAIAGLPIQTDDQAIPTGDEYLAYLRSIVEILDLDVRTYERVESISGSIGAFTVSTRRLDGSAETYQAKCIVLATGNMNAPRMIGVPGEDLPHVTHLWNDPHIYFGRNLLIVGGANSAVEAAIRCWRAGAHVAISYRRETLDKKHLISRLYLEIDLLIKNGQIAFYPNTEPVEFRPGAAVLRRLADNDLPTGYRLEEPVSTDFVYLATGFTMDRTLYEQCDVEVEGAEGRPVVDPATMESNVPGVYVVGTATGGDQRHYSVFITTSHEHCLKAGRDLAAGFSPATVVRDEWVGNLARRDYPLSSEDVE